MLGYLLLLYIGRTREEYFSGECDLDSIKRLKEILKIPVIGNGNIKNEKDAKRMLEYTNADGIMVARGAIRKSIYI